jgi:5-formyltetrahydrofolate cyclo-ligase
MSQMDMAAERKRLRKQLRATRDALPRLEQRRAAQTVAGLLARSRWLRAGRRVGLYLSTGSELGTVPLLSLALARGCKLWLPRITRSYEAKMCFSPLNGRLRLNRYGIVEPDTDERICASELEVILMPLVGVDTRGHRLGMGAGYYDRLLAFRLRRQIWRGPTLVGLGYALQKVAQIPAAPHDVPLDALVTEHGIETFTGENR